MVSLAREQRIENERSGIATGYGGMIMVMGFLPALLFSSGLAAIIAGVLVRRSFRPGALLAVLLLKRRKNLT